MPQFGTKQLLVQPQNITRIELPTELCMTGGTLEKKGKPDYIIGGFTTGVN